MKYLNKTVEDFDNYEKYAFEVFGKNFEYIESWIDLHLHKVHFKDKWDMFVSTTLLLESDEYASELLVVPSSMWKRVESHKRICEIPVETTVIMGGKRSYTIIYDSYD